jgi:hypothetical protein
VLVPGDSLGNRSLVVCLFRCRTRDGSRIGARKSNDSWVSKDPLRDEAGSLRGSEIRPGIESSGRGGNHRSLHRYTVYSLF